MSQDTQNAQPSADGEMAAKLPEELLPVYDWYRTQGRQLVLSAALLLLVALGTAAFLRYRANQASLASAALMTTGSVEGFENLERQYGNTRVGPLIRLGLAKAYFNGGNIQGARQIYETFLKRHPRHAQADIARIGLAATLEEEQDFAKAGQAFETFVQEHPDHYLYPVAVMGFARCLAAQQQKDAAFDQLDRLVVSKAGTPWEEMARDLRGVIERFEGFKSRSFFDQMDAAAKQLPAGDIPSAVDALDALPVTPAVSNAVETVADPAATGSTPAEVPVEAPAPPATHE